MLKRGLFKKIFEKVDQLIVGRGKIDEALFEELEESLIGADLNVHTTLKAMDELREMVRDKRLHDATDVTDHLKRFLWDTLTAQGGISPLIVAPAPPTVYLVVGVNGVGKTTSIAKLAYKLKGEGKRVILAAADTFRAAAVAGRASAWPRRRIGKSTIRPNSPLCWKPWKASRRSSTTLNRAINKSRWPT